MNIETKICDLSATLTRMGDNVTLLKQLAEFCREDLPIYLGRLKTAVDAGNSPEVQLAAHSVKGLVVNFNAEPAANAAIRLERMGQSGDLTGAAEAYRELEQQAARLIEVLTVELAQL
jgi:hypothetical protein